MTRLPSLSELGRGWWRVRRTVGVGQGEGIWLFSAFSVGLYNEEGLELQDLGPKEGCLYRLEPCWTELPELMAK